MTRLGKTPARPGAVRLGFSTLFRAEKLPSPPPVFGHESVDRNWGMLANDRWGCCVWSGGAHEHMLWTRAGGDSPAMFSDDVVLQDYASVTGFDGTDATDAGTDLQMAASYRRTTGMLDASGRRHQIAAYMALRVGDWDEMMLAAWLFGAVGVGVVAPASLSEQFDAGVPWSVVPGDGRPSVGGHYVPVVGRNSRGEALCVTWGRLHAMTREFYERYNDETVAFFSPEYADVNKLSPEGFDAGALGAYLRELS